jgi:hypothetical protein
MFYAVAYTSQFGVFGDQGHRARKARDSRERCLLWTRFPVHQLNEDREGARISKSTQTVGKVRQVHSGYRVHAQFGESPWIPEEDCSQGIGKGCAGFLVGSHGGGAGQSRQSYQRVQATPFPVALAGKHAEGAQLGAGRGIDQLGRLVRQVIKGSLPCGVGEARSQATF